MSLEELREYAKNQDDLIATQKTELEDKDTVIKTMNELNIDLQKRNLSLFKQVTQPSALAEEEEQTAETIEEFATNNYKEFIK